MLFFVFLVGGWWFCIDHLALCSRVTVLQHYCLFYLHNILAERW